MSRVVLVPILFVLASIAGCLGGDDGDPSTTSPTGDDSTTGPNCCANITLTVRILNATGSVNASEPVNITWEVSMDADVNSTDLVVEHTDVHWGNESVDQPANDSAYPNMTDEQSGPVGVFNASFTIDTNGTFHARAHAMLNGTHYWSEEVTIEVMSAGPGEVHTIEIGGLGAGPLSQYDPDEVTIKVGDGVKWINNDPAGLPHTATGDEGPAEFDTGNIADGQESEVIVFTVAGTYDYICNVHPNTMSGSLTVE